MDCGFAISDWNEEIKHISFIFLVPLWPSHLSLPGIVPPVGVSFPVFVHLFQMSSVCLTPCQILSSLVEYFQLLLVVAADFLILLRNACQSLHDEEELLVGGSAMTFKSSSHGLGREL